MTNDGSRYSAPKPIFVHFKAATDTYRIECVGCQRQSQRAIPLYQFKQWKRAMFAWWHQKILPSRGREEPLQAVIVIRHAIFERQVERGLILAQAGEEIGGGDEDSELELGLLGTIGNIQRVEAGAVHTHMNGGVIRGARGA